VGFEKGNIGSTLLAHKFHYYTPRWLHSCRNKEYFDREKLEQAGIVLNALLYLIVLGDIASKSFPNKERVTNVTNSSG
jgi:hypothetical protein